MQDDTTPRDYKLPHPENIAAEDVLRIREAITGIDTDITELEQQCARLKAELKSRKLEQILEGSI